ncbi:hypothetical protein ACFY1U_23235 [Streptomyces sp. NPDC001351]|uniref:hypothetical protein n=1 Tax=Streptomyces sp. NPDC001351 TaxID=3364564 RepID=UPI00367E7E4D
MGPSASSPGGIPDVSAYPAPDNGPVEAGPASAVRTAVSAARLAEIARRSAARAASAGLASVPFGASEG